MGFRKRIGIVGYGHLGRYLAKAVLENDDLELAFVWNRSQDKLFESLDSRYICKNITECGQYSPDLIVEVSHPDISEKYGSMFLDICDYMIGSPSSLANKVIESTLRVSATKNGVYIPAGALWGGEDIKKMADRNSLKGLKITMKKHPSCFKLEEPLKEMNKNVSGSQVVLYDGPVRELCTLAPNNVNTMAAGAIAAHNIGFDQVRGCLISDPGLKEWHIVEVEVIGPEVNGNKFKVKTTRMNPADPGAVTGSATYSSFLSSLLRAGGKGHGIHLC